MNVSAFLAVNKRQQNMRVELELTRNVNELLATVAWIRQSLDRIFYEGEIEMHDIQSQLFKDLYSDIDEALAQFGLDGRELDDDIWYRVTAEVVAGMVANGGVK